MLRRALLNAATLSGEAARAHEQHDREQQDDRDVAEPDEA